VGEKNGELLHYLLNEDLQVIQDTYNSGVDFSSNQFTSLERNCTTSEGNIEKEEEDDGSVTVMEDETENRFFPSIDSSRELIPDTFVLFDEVLPDETIDKSINIVQDTFAGGLSSYLNQKETLDIIPDTYLSYSNESYFHLIARNEPAEEKQEEKDIVKDSYDQNEIIFADVYDGNVGSLSFPALRNRLSESQNTAAITLCSPNSCRTLSQTFEEIKVQSKLIFQNDVTDNHGVDEEEDVSSNFEEDWVENYMTQLSPRPTKNTSEEEILSISPIEGNSPCCILSQNSTPQSEILYIDSSAAEKSYGCCTSQTNSFSAFIQQVIFLYC
jgi:hypothetical protein